MNDKEERLLRITERVKSRIENSSSSELSDVYTKFKKISSLLLRISQLDGEIENVKKKTLSNRNVKNNLIQLILFIVVVTSILYFESIEYTVFVFFLYFAYEVDKKIDKNSNQLLLELKNTEKNQLQLECISYRFEINEIEYLSKQISEIPEVLDSFSYFYKNINIPIFDRIFESEDIKKDIQHLITSESPFK